MNESTDESETKEQNKPKPRRKRDSNSVRIAKDLEREELLRQFNLLKLVGTDYEIEEMRDNIKLRLKELR